MKTCPNCKAKNNDDWPITVEGKIREGGCQECWETECAKGWWKGQAAVERAPKKRETIYLIVMLTSRGVSYLAEGRGDPARSYNRESAREFSRHDEAERVIAELRAQYPYRQGYEIMSEEIELKDSDDELLGYIADELEWMEFSLLDYGINISKEMIARILWMAEKDVSTLRINQEEMP